MNGFSWIEVIKQFPNLAGLIILSATLFLIYDQQRQESIVLRGLLVACFTSEGVIR